LEGSVNDLIISLSQLKDPKSLKPQVRRAAVEHYCYANLLQSHVVWYMRAKVSENPAAYIVRIKEKHK
jgi:hypothetical protein